MRAIPCLLSLLIISIVALGRDVALPLNDGAGCAEVNEELSEVTYKFSTDESLEDGKYEIYTCCGGIKLYVQLKKNQSGGVFIEGWSVRDPEKRLLKIETYEQQAQSTPVGSGATEPIIQIIAKKDDKRIACFAYFKKG